MTLTTILVAWLAAFGLRILHLLYASFIAILSCRQFIHGPIPRPLGAPRKQLPTHLALLLVSDSRSSISELERVYVESVKRASIWCQDLCIENLTVYDRNGKRALYIFVGFQLTSVIKVSWFLVGKKYAILLGNNAGRRINL